jgi:acetyl esterase/lipase
VENSLAFFAALRHAGVPAELHIYEHGPHGAGLALDDPALSTWPKLLENWFRVRGLLPKNVLPQKQVFRSQFSVTSTSRGTTDGGHAAQ